MSRTSNVSPPHAQKKQRPADIEKTKDEFLSAIAIPWYRDEAQFREVVALLQQILFILGASAPTTISGPGGATSAAFAVNVLVVNSAGASTATQLASASLPIKMGWLQSIAVNPVTFSNSKSVAAGVGAILNPAPQSGQAGGAAPLGAIDLSSIWWISSGATDAVVVYYLT